MNALVRRSNNINIAQFWENCQLKKYNFSPSYQRMGDVWSQSKKSFLLDTIMKNFPMPPIFLHEHIDSDTGKTIYDVIDGKQRLTSIISFIKDEISLPDDFAEDGFGDESLNGLKFSDFDRLKYLEEKKAFWKYEITIEYVDTEQIDVVNNIFDRLNRNGEPLTPQELRKAKYNRTPLYLLISVLAEIKFWQDNLLKLKINRLDDAEFISELLFVLLEKQILGADREIIDKLYEKYSSPNAIIDIDKLTTQFQSISSIIEGFNLDMQKYKIDSVSHLYGLWGFAWQLHENGITENLSSKLDDFYKKLRAKDRNKDVQSYHSSMQAGTKSKSYRVKRINALLGFCGFNEFKIS